MNQIKPVLEYPLVITGLSEEEKVAISFLRSHPLMPAFIRSELKIFFPEFPVDDEETLREATDLYLLLQADSGKLQRVIEHLMREKG